MSANGAPHVHAGFASIEKSHPIFRIVRRVLFFLEIVEQIDVIGIIEFVPFRDRRRGHAAALGEGFDDPLLEIGIEDVADADHGYMPQFGCCGMELLSVM
jgi:hypothetical protein